VDKEVWKDIPGYEGYYQASKSGLIKSVRAENIFTTRGRKLTRKVKILKTSINDRGYKYLSLHTDKIKKTCTVHILIALTWVENPENKPEVNHKDGNKLNNNDWNLEWSTRSENVQHAYDLGLYNNKKPCFEHHYGNKYRLGMVHSEETKAKISNSKKNKLINPNTKNIKLVIDSETGVYYYSIREAAKFNDIKYWFLFDQIKKGTSKRFLLC